MGLHEWRGGAFVGEQDTEEEAGGGSQRRGHRTSPYPSTQEEDAAAAAAKLLQSCPTLCDPIDGSPLGPAVPEILQARTLECVAISSSNA